MMKKLMKNLVNGYNKTNDQKKCILLIFFKDKFLFSNAHFEHLDDACDGDDDDDPENVIIFIIFVKLYY